MSEPEPKSFRGRGHQGPETKTRSLDLSVIIPIFNEEEGISPLYNRLKEVLSRAGRSWEIVFVDDGSRDDSLRSLRALKEASQDDPPVTIVQLSRNFGQHPAIVAGFSAARGETLVALDADLQIDPVHIVEMLDKIAAGHDFVSGIRRGRTDPLLLRRLPSSLLNRLIGAITGKKLRDYGCPLNVMRAEIAETMRAYGDMQRFYKALAVKLARRVAEVEVTHRERLRGRSRYDFLKLLDLFFDFVTNFSRRLFQRVALAGFAISGLTLAAGILYLVLRFPFSLVQPSPRFMLVALICLIFGMQLLILGVLGDFIVRIYRQSDPKPIFVIKKIW